ncbi:hypothetical protein [Trujillonella humicola]|uniref:hypothetical protein n=1 Tax=Trujillonella humicola TaxID=3383699 RepID=UPI003905A66B
MRRVQVMGEAGDPAVRALCAVGESVAYLFMEGLAECEVQGRHSEIRLLVNAAPDRPDVVVEALDERRGFEAVVVGVPPHVADVPVQPRSLLALDALRAGVGRLGELRGWDPRTLDDIRDHVLARGLVFTWYGDWKRSPDGRHEVRAAFQFTELGTGRRGLQLRTTGADRLLTWSDQLEWRSSWEGFARSMRYLRWSDDGTASLEALTLRPDAPPAALTELITDAPAADPDQPRPPVSLLIRDDTWREIRFTGGMLGLGVVSTAYVDQLCTLLKQLERDEWQRWWSSADLPILDVSYWIGDDRTDRMFVRRGNGQLIARVEHSPAELRDDDPDRQAEEDVLRLVAAIQRRMGLDEPPPFR